VLAKISICQFKIYCRILEKKPHQPWLVFTRVLYPGRIGIWNVRLCTGRKTVGARQVPTTNSIHLWRWTGMEPASHWWEGSALATVSSLTSSFDYSDKKMAKFSPAPTDKMPI